MWSLRHCSRQPSGYLHLIFNISTLDIFHNLSSNFLPDFGFDISTLNVIIVINRFQYKYLIPCDLFQLYPTSWGLAKAVSSTHNAVHQEVDPADSNSVKTLIRHYDSEFPSILDDTKVMKA